MQARRLTFQLTPLLDLLLIVIFAQYMEVRQTTAAADQNLKQQQADLESKFEERRQTMEVRLREQQQALDADRRKYGEQFESILSQHQRAGAAIAEALNLPGRMMENVLSLREEGRVTEADRLEAAVTQIQNALQSRDQKMMEFVLRYDEMRKHVSMWEIYLQDNGKAFFTDGETRHLISYSSIDEFVSSCFEASKSFTEPKPLVIILLSYGSPYAVQRQRATDGMPLLVERLRRDSGETRWFDFSLMGYYASGPILGQHSSSDEARLADPVP